MSVFAKRKKKKFFYQQGSKNGNKSNISMFTVSHRIFVTWLVFRIMVLHIDIFLSDYLAIGDEVVTYEDVIKFSPDPGRKRPIVLVGMLDIHNTFYYKGTFGMHFPNTGAPGVGKKTLIQQLLKLEPGHFSECIQRKCMHVSHVIIIILTLQ